MVQQYKRSTVYVEDVLLRIPILEPKEHVAKTKASSCTTPLAAASGIVVGAGPVVRRSINRHQKRGDIIIIIIVVVEEVVD